MRQFVILLCMVGVMKYIETGVIMNASKINYFNEPNKTPELKLLKKPIPLIKKVPLSYFPFTNKLGKILKISKQPRGLSKIQHKASKQVDELIEKDLNEINFYKETPLYHTDSFKRFEDVKEQTNKEIGQKNNEVVEISLLQEDYVNTENIQIKTEPEEIEDDNQRRLREFIKSHTVIPIKADDCHYEFTEEQKDLDEFIFMLSSQGPWEDVVDDVEITTEISIANPRPKRSISIIEEENMGSTVSGFKFTGRDMKLNNELYYKNINS